MICNSRNQGKVAKTSARSLGDLTTQLQPATLFSVKEYATD